MNKYTLADGALVKTQIESAKTLDEMINRTYSVPTRYDMSQYYKNRQYRNKQNSIFERGLGTKAFTPSNLVKWDSTRKCFVWKDDGKIYVIYDASNVKMTIRGFYLLDFDISTLADAKNRKSNKKRYALMTTLCEDMLADCRMTDKKMVDSPMFDFTNIDRLNEYRAVWAVRQLITKAFKAGKRISVGALTEMFVKTKYDSKFEGKVYSFGEYVRIVAQELIKILAETEKDGQSGGGRPDSDDGRP